MDKYTPQQLADYALYVEGCREIDAEPLTIEQHLEFSAAFDE